MYQNPDTFVEISDPDFVQDRETLFQCSACSALIYPHFDHFTVNAINELPDKIPTSPLKSMTPILHERVIFQCLALTYPHFGHFS